MKLSALLDSGVELIGSGETEITGLCFDTRKLRPGDLYAAINGSRADGHIFIPDAIARGAVAILGAPSASVFATAIPVVIDDNPRLRLSLMAARMTPGQPRVTVGVTGTNGKTSVASFCRQIWDRLGMRAASLGTLGVEGEGRWPQTQLTTPDPVLLHRLCSQMAASGVDHLALEASSHGLDQFRLDAIAFSAAAFTNISRDHYDYHGSYEAYFKAKSRMFAELLGDDGVAILNADIPEFGQLRAIVEGRGIAMIDYGRQAKCYRIVDIRPEAIGQAIEFEIDGDRHVVETPLVGRFQASNMLAALGLAVAGGAPLAGALDQLGSLRPAPGRMEHVVTHSCGAPAFVDFAHTPDALEKALAALRPHTAGRLHVVFGCGGDRDAGKRPLMGEIACRLADLAYVTDDNPRSEDPARIRREILAATDSGKTVEIGDRARAIRAAFAALEPGDVLVVAGKGHESGQLVGDQTFPFNDAVELKKALRESGGDA
ncbi:MAG: UDP-N-acetylmuramoyl-L-alanyl-D-glutamate--2,6-diaminopimelate ligase [Geminicoccaceae bacterium]